MDKFNLESRSINDRVIMIETRLSDLIESNKEHYSELRSDVKTIISKLNNVPSKDEVDKNSDFRKKTQAEFGIWKFLAGAGCGVSLFLTAIIIFFG